MYQGRLVEQGPVRQILRAPAHEYTQACSPRCPAWHAVTRRARRTALMPLLEVAASDQALRPQAGAVRHALGRQGGGRRQLHDRRRRDVRPGRRVGQRQEHDRPLHPAADRADVGRGAVPRRERAGFSRDAHAAGAARHADRLPGSVLVAQPAHARRRHRRGAARSFTSSASQRRAARARGASCSSWSASSRPPRPLSARVQRRPAAAHRHRPRARAQPGARSSPTRPCRRSTCRFRRRSSGCCSICRRG